MGRGEGHGMDQGVCLSLGWYIGVEGGRSLEGSNDLGGGRRREA